jgi:hypothetical protein
VRTDEELEEEGLSWDELERKTVEQERRQLELAKK